MLVSICILLLAKLEKTLATEGCQDPLSKGVTF
jgi:hypothetical protein